MRNLELLFIIVYLLISDVLNAQPGGGGGLRITNLYNQKGEKINIYSDSSTKIRTFILRNDSLIKETFIFQDLIKRQQALTSQNPYQQNFVLALVAPHFTERKPHEPYNKFGQRLLITYKNDTMMMDIYGIISPNGAGHIDRMDSLFFKKGHYKFFTKRKIDQNYIYNIWQEHSKLIQTGFTPYTLPKLTTLGFITYTKQIDTSFLLHKNLPKSFFVERAKYYLQNNADTKLVFADIKNAIKKNNGVEDYEIWFLLSDAYAKIGKHQKAIKYISLALNCKRYAFDNQYTQYVERNYKKRIDLYTKTKQFDKAIADYDTLYSLTKDKQWQNIERAKFKATQLKDYQGAITDLKKYIASIPQQGLDSMPNNHRHNSYLWPTYLALADIEYLTNDIKSSGKNWLNAIKSGYGSYSNTDTKKFDALITAHPDIPQFYFCRAWVLYCNSITEDKQTKRTLLENAQKDIDKAQELDMDMNEMNYYRNKIINYAKKLQ